MIEAFLLIILFIVLATLAVFWHLGNKSNEVQKADLQRESTSKREKIQKENTN